ncbi:MAG: Gfo/Idh/MocA family protein, partial [Gemmataceae bacterium]
MDRRHFLATTAASSAALSAGATPARITDKKPRVGLIGTGWYGKCDLFRLMQVAPVQVISLCDVDSKMLADAAEQVANKQGGAKPRTYDDYRKMLAEKDLDIVIVGTPDHWHALPMIAAVEAGADVYVQKPTGVDVLESKAMLEAARKHNRVVQVGTQRRSTPHLMEAKERIVQEGKLGKIGLVEIYCYYHMRTRENPPDSDPPAHLNYEMWTGPAPLRPYNKLVHPRSWRAFEEYGNGIVGDMCIHMLDMVRWVLGLGWPKSVTSQGGILIDPASKANIPDTQTATFDFNGLPIQWTHRTYGHAPDPQYPWGATLYGEKGTLKLSVNRYDFLPFGGGQKPLSGTALFEHDKFPEDKTEKDLEQHVASAIRGHMRDFLKAIASRGKPVADIEEGHISTASCILANLSMKLGRTLKWDPATHTVLNDAEATK